MKWRVRVGLFAYFSPLRCPRSGSSGESAIFFRDFPQFSTFGRTAVPRRVESGENIFPLPAEKGAARAERKISESH